jgi:hypothetical protein
MRYPILLASLGASLLAQGPPNCTGIGLDVDVRCACYKDPNSKLCEMVRAGFYEPRDWSKTKPINLGVGGVIYQPGIPPGNRPAPQPVQPVQPQQARVVPLAHSDYLRFLHPNANLAAGFTSERAVRSPELLDALFGRAESEDARNKAIRAVREMDHVWVSFAAPNDLVVLATGKFEQGAAAGMFYARGIRPVFLGGAGAMIIGPEPAIQGALARLAKPTGNDAGWVARRARETSRGHESWIVNERPAAAGSSVALQAIRRFAIGFQQDGIDGEAVADSEAGAVQVGAWIDRMKTGSAGALDSLAVTRDGSTLRFAAKGDALLAGEAGKAAMNSDFGVELYSVIIGGFPGLPARTVAADKVLAVKTGMKREELLTLLGQPLSVYAIQGLDPPRETWTYQVPFGKQLMVRLDGGVVAVPPR